jgi:hypothetical protein
MEKKNAIKKASVGRRPDVMEKSIGRVHEKRAAKPAPTVHEKTDNTDLIREAAYSLYVKRGYVHGNDSQDWMEAEELINNFKIVEEAILARM